jgi:hypothetical protein
MRTHKRVLSVQHKFDPDLLRPYDVSKATVLESLWAAPRYDKETALRR